MRISGILALVGLLAAMTGAAGCNTVSRQEYSDLQQEYNRLGEVNRSLTAEITTAKGNEARLMADVLAARQDKNAAEMKMTQLQAENQRLAKAAAAPAPQTDTPEGWQAVRGGAQVSLGSDVLFGSGKATLTSAGKARVAKVAATIRSKYAGATVRVYGHTDNVPIRKSKWADNLALSAERAMAVARGLTKAGVPAKNIETIAMGSDHPAASNKSAAGRAKNRRVVVKVTQ